MDLVLPAPFLLFQQYWGLELSSDPNAAVHILTWQFYRLV